MSKFSGSGIGDLFDVLEEIQTPLKLLNEKK